MTRSLLCGVALVSVAAGAVLWAASPNCQGGFCLDRGLKTEARQDGAGASAVPGTGREIQMGSTGKTVPEAASSDRLSNEAMPDPWREAEALEEASEAAEAPEDWQDQPAATTSPASYGNTAGGEVAAYRDPQPSYRQKRARQAAEAKAAKQWDTLVEAALGEPDDELRGQAINGVGLRRSTDSVAVLSDVATFDPAPNNRLRAVQQLWYSAADGLGSDGGIENTLRSALDDPDEAIAEMAEKALADLEALEEAWEEARGVN